MSQALRTRRHFARLSVRCMRDALNGVTRVNDLPRYIEWLKESFRAAMCGDSDHTFAFRQMAHYFATGECVPLFPTASRCAA